MPQQSSFRKLKKPVEIDLFSFVEYQWTLWILKHFTYKLHELKYLLISIFFLFFLTVLMEVAFSKFCLNCRSKNPRALNLWKEYFLEYRLFEQTSQDQRTPPILWGIVSSWSCLHLHKTSASVDETILL